MEDFIMENAMLLIPIVFGLMLLVNIFTEVLKKILIDKVPTNLLVFILSIVITIIAMFVYLAIAEIAFVWWMIFAAIAVAFFVAYSAMFGFDKWKELIDQWKQFRK
jgi:glucan phosphoethanolaminetransferase (alkaline phosphatase superfamily)